jgi:hypothetical protein
VDILKEKGFGRSRPKEQARIRGTGRGRRDDTGFLVGRD